MTITSFEILPPAIHLLSWDMIRLMYALTWSSDETDIEALAIWKDGSYMTWTTLTQHVQSILLDSA